MTKSEILQRLKSGNARFVSDNMNHGLLDSRRRNALLDGQNPHTIILSCADSRIVPEHMFDAGLGELFVIRVAGNIANRESIASIEYAVAHLGSKIIIVLGHESCGAVNAAIAGGDHGDNLNHLLEYIQPAISACSVDASFDDIIRKNTSLTAARLNLQSKIINEAVDSGKVQIIEAYYSLKTGEVSFL